MNILWVVNIIVSDMANALGKVSGTVFGGWIESAAVELVKEKDFHLTIVTSGAVQRVEKREINGITYIVIPSSTSRLQLKPVRQQLSYCRSVLEEQRPDCIHIHGTEYPLGLGMLSENADRCPVFVSIQGILPLCVQEFYCGLFDTLYYRESRVWRKILTKLPIIIQRNRLADRLKIEQQYLEQANYLCGRTECDQAYTKSGKGTYIHSGEVLRDTFYSGSWNHSSIERHTIFIGNTIYSLKGFHHLLVAVSLLVKTYPDLKVFAAGESHTPNSYKDIRHRVGYSYFIRKVIKTCGLENRIVFTGLLSAEGIKKQMLTSHVNVVCSSAENSPNTLGEAMMLGVPSVVSYSGGTPSMASDKEEVLFYSNSDPVMLAHAIESIWLNDEKAKELSVNSRKRARENHNHDHIKELAESYRKAQQQR